MGIWSGTLGQRPRRAPSLAAAGLCVAISSCGGSGGQSPVAPGSSNEGSFPPPIAHKVALADGGELVAQFTEFHPPRGAKLARGQGAYVRLQWEMPRRPVLVSAAGDAWDGAQSLPTSFMTSNILFALPVCTTDPPTLLNRTDQFGRASHPRFEFPRPGDPDVPFVRIRLWITEWPHGCSGNLPMPPIREIQESPPILTAVERVDWRKP